MENESSKITSLTPETRELLLRSLLHYLHRSGFSKTLKRFLSEAQIQDETWKDSAVNLEDVYCKYIEDSCQTEDNGAVESETKAKKKKKNKHDLASGDEAKATKSEAVEKPVDDGTKEDNGVVESETKAKKKKKNKHDLGSGGEVKETKSEAVTKPADDTANEDNVVAESETKVKKKKNKKQDLPSGDDVKETKTKADVKETKTEAVKEPVDDNKNDLEANEPKKKSKDKKKKSKEQDEGAKEVGDVEEEKKSSKKRKRPLSEENGHESDNMETNGTVEEAAKDNGFEEQNAHNNEKTETNGEEKSGPQKSVKKQRVGSAEPKTVNAFQRVKIDQVEFAHEKLQDNSYWAKDGAEIGYGAKAQEVLGQVRGRDFRHEKTKKKRGSYRGGQIDLQSHSIKFNYDDEE